jgi:hypothetical protein
LSKKVSDTLQSNDKEQIENVIFSLINMRDDWKIIEVDSKLKDKPNQEHMFTNKQIDDILKNAWYTGNLHKEPKTFWNILWESNPVSVLFF